ncbi:MAG: hypothetical protein LWX70_02880 [Sphingobacteriia bacterium]|nr:hypothetical protein [Sphingobacteriia bacterium]
MLCKGIDRGQNSTAFRFVLGTNLHFVTICAEAKLCFARVLAGGKTQLRFVLCWGQTFTSLRFVQGQTFAAQGYWQGAKLNFVSFCAAKSFEQVQIFAG